jgi:hypothetical protein
MDTNQAATARSCSCCAAEEPAVVLPPVHGKCQIRRHVRHSWYRPVSLVFNKRRYTQNPGARTTHSTIHGPSGWNLSHDFYYRAY